MTQLSPMFWQLRGGRFKREGTYVYLQLTHVAVWQKLGEGSGNPLQYSHLEDLMDRGG